MSTHPTISRNAFAAFVLIGALEAPALASAKTCKSWGFIGQGTANAKATARANF